MQTTWVAMAILALASCATTPKLPEADSHNPIELVEDGPTDVADSAVAEVANTSETPTSNVISEPALPCRSLVVETDANLSGKTRTKTTRTDYTWDSNGRLKLARTTTEDTKYGTSWSERAYRYQEDGLPLELEVKGEATSLEGKKVAESRVTRRWKWEDGKLRELEWAQGSGDSVVRAKFSLEWPTGTDSIPFRGEHIDALTWVHRSRDSEDFYSLYFGGAAGSPVVRGATCRQHQRSTETCEESEVSLKFDSYGRLQEVVLPAHQTLLLSGPFGLKQSVKESRSGKLTERDTTTWNYDEKGLLLKVHVLTETGFREGTEAAQKHGTELRPSRYSAAQIIRDEKNRAVAYQIQFGDRAENLGRPVIQHQWSYDCAE